MADRHPMWKELGMDIEKHDVLCSVLPGAFGDVFMSQKNRPKGMEFWDMVVSDVHGIRPAEIEPVDLRKHFLQVEQERSGNKGHKHFIRVRGKTGGAWRR